MLLQLLIFPLQGQVGMTGVGAGHWNGHFVFGVVAHGLVGLGHGLVGLVHGLVGLVHGLVGLEQPQGLVWVGQVEQVARPQEDVEPPVELEQPQLDAVDFCKR